MTDEINLIGKIIDRYAIQNKLGEGGMAVVYKALDTRLKRDVALKLIRTEMFPPALLEQMLERFEREATVLARMQHPNIVTVHDFGEYERAPYLVMEYLPGGTLRQRMSRPISYTQAAATLHPIANALAYAHSKNIAHRDVKPVNILFSETGAPKLSDFGIARLLGVDETTQLTATGMGIGTPSYMAPEQWRGKISPAVDIYALGVVFYEMLTGRLPYASKTPADLLVKMATEPLPDPRLRVPGLPETVIAVLHQALAQDPTKRFATMNAFANAFGGLVNGNIAATPRDAEQTPLFVDSGATIHVPTPIPQPLGRVEYPASPLAAARATSKRRGWRSPGGVVVGFGGLLILLTLCGLAIFGLWKSSRPIAMPAATATFTPESTATLSVATTQPDNLPAPSSVSATPTTTKALETTVSPTMTPYPDASATAAPSPSPTIPACEITISLTRNVNCRTGPAAAYGWITSFEAGSQLTAFGKNSNGTWLWVLIPGQQNSYCWLITQYGTVTGNPDCLPTIVAPPLPTSQPTEKPNEPSPNEPSEPTLPPP